MGIRYVSHAGRQIDGGTPRDRLRCTSPASPLHLPYISRPYPSPYPYPYPYPYP